MSEGPNKNQRLVKAAEALVQAASMEVDTMTQQKLSKDLEALKESFNKKLNSVTQTVKTNSENFDAKINTVNQNLVAVKNLLEEQKNLLEEQKKRQKSEHLLQMITCSHLGSFSYFIPTGDAYYGHISEYKSSDLVKSILEWFAIGKGRNLPAKAQVDNSTRNCNKETLQKSQKNFRNKLMMQVQDLIGHEPRLVDNGDGKYSIFYS